MAGLVGCDQNHVILAQIHPGLHFIEIGNNHDLGADVLHAPNTRSPRREFNLLIVPVIGETMVVLSNESCGLATVALALFNLVQRTFDLGFGDIE